MGIEIGHLAAKRKPLAVEWAGETVNVVYRPYTLAMGEQLRAAVLANKSYVVEEMERLLLEWDITEDGEVLPIDAASLTRLPLELLNTISDAILTEMYPNRRSGGATAAGSSPEAK